MKIAYISLDLPDHIQRKALRELVKEEFREWAKKYRQRELAAENKIKFTSDDKSS